MTRNSEILLLALFEAVPPGDQCDLFAKALCETTASIEPWLKATSDHPVVNEMIIMVQDVVVFFYSALKSSRDAALHGYRLLQDMSTFVHHLRDENTSVEELQEHIRGMSSRAEKAHKNAQRVCLHFSEMRKGIYAITNRIPAEVSGLGDEEHRIMKKVAAGEKELRTLKVVKSCSIAGAAVVAAVSVVTFPPALLFLPVALPLLTLVIEAREIQLAKKIEKREKKVYECRDAIAQLERIAEGLQKLDAFNDGLTQFWSRAETSLEVLKGRVGELRGAKFLKLELSTIEKTCEELGRAQLSYYDRVKNLEMYMPTPAATLETGSRAETDPPFADANSVCSQVTLRRHNALKRRESEETIPSIVISGTDNLPAPLDSRTNRSSRSTPTESCSLSSRICSCSSRKEDRTFNGSDVPRDALIQRTHASATTAAHRDKPRSRHHSPRRSEGARSRSPPPSRDSGSGGSRSSNKLRSSESSRDSRRSSSPASSRRSESPMLKVVTTVTKSVPSARSPRRGSNDHRR
ncbi:hypothetical protein D9615_004296 [Tricholomella constricta]|uniref:Uncharacterized protein n=1 Tax=Tricholomella constricta TaxID=117010 RepID=A0A8H5HEQ7_9AGAR|nr:hypothetical protein D9615_004296 [Tricholomella constricta]